MVRTAGRARCPRSQAADWRDTLLAAGNIKEEDLTLFIVTDDLAEVVRGHGAPTLRFSKAAEARLAALGAYRALVSLTHERRQAAASVLLLRDG